MAVAGLVLDRPQANDRPSRMVGARNAAKSSFKMQQHELDDLEVLPQTNGQRVGNMMVLPPGREKGFGDRIPDGTATTASIMSGEAL